MNIVPETNNTQVACNNKPIISVQWLVLLVSLLILLVVVFATYHRSLSASGIPPATITINQDNAGGQAPAQAKAARDTDKLANIPSIWPTSGAVTSGFGWRNPPLEGGSELHQGLDIAAEMNSPVVATADGTVVKSGWAGGYGNLVQIDHGNGIETLYGHNAQLVVSVGQNVKKGQVISYAGSTGISTGPHVHYEVRVNGTAVDPMKYLVHY